MASHAGLDAHAKPQGHSVGRRNTTVQLRLASSSWWSPHPGEGIRPAAARQRAAPFQRASLLFTRLSRWLASSRTHAAGSSRFISCFGGGVHGRSLSPGRQTSTSDTVLDYHSLLCMLPDQLCAGLDTSSCLIWSFAFRYPRYPSLSGVLESDALISIPTCIDKRPIPRYGSSM